MSFPDLPSTFAPARSTPEHGAQVRQRRVSRRGTSRARLSRRTATAPAAPIPQRSSLSPTPRALLTASRPPHVRALPQETPLWRKGWVPAGASEATPLCNACGLLCAPRPPRVPARTPRFFSFVKFKKRSAVLLQLSSLPRFGSPFSKKESAPRRPPRKPRAPPFNPTVPSLRSLRSRGLTPFPTRTTVAGTSAAGSARGARPSTASARRRTTKRRSARQDPAPNSGSGATGATAGRTSRASSQTTPRVSERDARCRSRRRLRFVFRATSHLAIASITRSLSIKRRKIRKR